LRLSRNRSIIIQIVVFLLQCPHQMCWFQVWENLVKTRKWSFWVTRAISYASHRIWTQLLDAKRQMQDRPRMNYHRMKKCNCLDIFNWIKIAVWLCAILNLAAILLFFLKMLFLEIHPLYSSSKYAKIRFLGQQIRSSNSHFLKKS
jgi:hypothetical protein